MAVVAACPCFGFAKESKWIGPASGGSYSDEANWNNGVPGGGDTAVFDTAVEITTSSARIQTGTAGLTINNSAAVTLGWRLQGTGPLIKKGSGELTFKANNWDGDYTGGAREVARLAARRPVRRLAAPMSSAGEASDRADGSGDLRGHSGNRRLERRLSIRAGRDGAPAVKVKAI